MQAKQRTALRITALIVVVSFALVLSGALGLMHADHHCAGEHCVICLQVQQLKELAQALCLLLALFALAPLKALLRALRHEGASFAFETPVSLKIRLNN